LYRGLNYFKKTYQSRSNLMKDMLEIPTTFWIVGRTTLSYWMYIWWVCVRQIEIHTSEPLVSDPSLVSLKLLLQNWEDLNRQVTNKFRQNFFKQEVKYYALRSIS
jgi:hypothetical protein